MGFIEGLRDSIRKNDYLWMALWLLIIINLWFFIFLGRGFSFWLFLAFFLFGGAGLWVIKHLSIPIELEEEVGSELAGQINELMYELKPLCDKIFGEEITEITRPTIETIRADFTTGLAWLWENGDDFLIQVEASINRIRLLISPLDSLNEIKSKLVQQLQADHGLLAAIVDEMRRGKENNSLDLDDFLESQVFSLKAEMEKEKDVFYEYVRRLLGRLAKNKDDIDIDEYFDINKLSQQFKVILEKALDARQMAFQDSIIRELENFSADIVGKMQKSTNQLLNTFQDAEDALGKIKQENWDGTNLSMRQLNECLSQVRSLREKSGEIMLTLAWQDILVEKRWQDMGERLFAIRERVQANVEEYLPGFISNRLAEEIPGFSTMAHSLDNVVFYKAMVDAEMIYQLYQGEKLLNIIGDGVYSLLQFIRPVEAIAARSVRLSEEGIRRCKQMKNEIKSGEFQPVFDRVLAVAEAENPALLPYLHDLFPRAFYAYCSYPYIKQKPDNLNQAAWCLFLELTENQNYEDQVYLLVAVLLVLHQLRNQFIHPLKNAPLEMEEPEDLECARLAALKAISIMLTIEFRGLSKLGFKGK